MKAFKLIFFSMIAGLIFTGCEDYDAGVDNASELPFAVAFSKSTQVVDVEETDPVYLVEIQATKKSSTDRVITVNYVPEGSTNLTGDFTYQSSVTIPAGSYVGYMAITFDYDNLALGQARIANFTIEADGFPINTRPSTAVTYVPLCTLNSVKLTINFDQYPGETAWQLYNAELSSVLASGGLNAAGTSIVGFPNQTTTSTEFCLEDGNYNMVFWDAYGDGFCCAYGNGTYSISANGSVIASGTGQFGQNLIVPFSL